MKEGFRQSMAWLHTWSGLLGGWILLLVFAAGTACYFKDEITFWMKPELHRISRTAVSQADVAERTLQTLQQRAPASSRWQIALPSEREPGVRVSWTPPPSRASGGEATPGRRGRTETATFDPVTGQPVDAARQTRGGEFFYRLHFDLHYIPSPWGRWIVGVCAMFMLVAILSGVITHRRIFADFFTFRPKKGQRSWLDAHNAVAVLALPYHLMITYTGIVTLMFIYMPYGQQAVYKGTLDSFFAEVFPVVSPRPPKPSGDKVPLAPIAPMMAQASARWGGAAVATIVVNNPGDRVSTVGMQRREGGDMLSTQPTALFNGATGELISTGGDKLGAAGETRSVVYGLHLGRFADPLLRALFFLSGLAGCAMVATGLLMWAVKERQKYAKLLKHGGRTGWGLRLVDGLNVGAIAGVPLAIVTYFWANRLLPAQMAGRSEAEVTWFFVALGVSMAAGLARPARRMWQAQLALGGLLFAAVPLLNAVTTTSHLGYSLTERVWPLAGFDLTCLALGVALLAGARGVTRRTPPKTKRHAKPVDATSAAGAATP